MWSHDQEEEEEEEEEEEMEKEGEGEGERRRITIISSWKLETKFAFSSKTVMRMRMVGELLRNRLIGGTTSRS